MDRELESPYQNRRENGAGIKVLKSRMTVVNKIQNLISFTEHRVAILSPAMLMSVSPPLNDSHLASGRGGRPGG